MLAQVGAAAPLRRNVTIEDVGNAAAFLCSDLAAGITGQVIYVDGGYNIVGMAFPERRRGRPGRPQASVGRRLQHFRRDPHRGLLAHALDVGGRARRGRPGPPAASGAGRARPACRLEGSPASTFVRTITA